MTSKCMTSIGQSGGIGIGIRLSGLGECILVARPLLCW